MRTTTSSVVVIASALLASLHVADASTLTPPVLPLIVRNPYLSTWLPNARDVPWKKWPMFYTGQEVGILATHVPGSEANGLRYTDWLWRSSFNTSNGYCISSPRTSS